MINKPYILFSRIDIVETQSGRIFCDPLWAKDLRLHLKYINDFRICCPVTYSNNVLGLEDISDIQITHLFELRKDFGFWSVIKNLFPNLLTVIKACKEARIVHSSGAGWAFPLSFYLLLVRPFFSFQWIMIIESSVWMLSRREKLTLRKVVSHYIHKIILSRCLRQADARIFTQSFYRKFFLKEEKDRTLITPATWIDANDLVSPEMVKKRLSERKGKTLELIFPARLTAEKGVFVLFDAIGYLSSINISVNVTIMGSGKLEKDCREFALKEFGNVKVVYRDPVDYGKKFFDALSEYDVVLVPNLKEEQPRIVFDAFSQGLGVIASDTSGILDITIDGENALIFNSGDPQSLSNVICHVINCPEIVLQMGLSGLKSVGGKTHLQMHLDRQKFLTRVLGT